MGDGPLLTWKDRRVRRPGEGPEASARKVPEVVRPGSLFFIPSPLEGWGLETLLDRLDDGAVVLFEKEPGLDEAVAGARRAWLGPRFDDPRVFVLHSDTEAEVQALFRRLPLSKVRRCEFLPLNGAWLAHAARYREVFHRFEGGLARWWSNRMTQLHLGPLWLRNLLDNLSQHRGGFVPLPDWGDDPVLVCGAGVSLEPALGWLVPHRSRVRVLAADTALGSLGQAEIVPDAVVCLEAQWANLRDFAGWKGRPVTLFADLTSLPAGTRVFDRPPVWIASRFAELGLWDDPSFPAVQRLPALGNVGGAAAWLATRLTRGPVVLAGLDFAYPPGRSHARGAPALAGALATTRRLAPPSGVGTWVREGVRVLGDGWLTTSIMEGYAAVLADQLAPHADRVFRWGEGPRDLGLSLWDHRPLAVLPALPTTGPSDGPAKPTWLEGQRQRWSDLAERLASPIEDWPDFVSKWREVEELTFWFPDPEPRNAPDWLRRARWQALWALERTRG